LASIAQSEASGKRDTLDHEDDFHELKTVLKAIIEDAKSYHCLAVFKGNKPAGVHPVRGGTIEAAAKWIKAKAKDHDVYLTLNRLKPPSVNPGKPWSGSDGSPINADVERIRHVFVDVDQDDTPEGKKQTIPERIEVAIQKAKDIEAFLQEEFRSVGISLLGCSGRGAQLWLRADIPATPASTKTVEAFIATLGSMFTGEGVHLDTGVNDLRRIARVCASGLFNVKTETAWPCSLICGPKDGKRLTLRDLEGFIEKYGAKPEGSESPLGIDSSPMSTTKADLGVGLSSVAPEANTGDLEAGNHDTPLAILEARKSADRIRGLLPYGESEILKSVHGDRRKAFQRMLKKFSGHLKYYGLGYMTGEVQGVLIAALKDHRKETTDQDIAGMIRDIWDKADPTPIQEDRSASLPAARTVEAPPAPAPDEDTTPGIFFPQSIDEAAFIGPIGRWAKLILPRTEASVENLLLSGLIAFGNALGRSCFYSIGSTKHYPNEFLLIIGRSAKARKGTGMSEARALMQELDEAWTKTRVKSGLSSGEGLIHQIRDEKLKKEPVKDKKTGLVTSYQWVIADPGVPDKRLLLVEEEFSRLLKMGKREGNTTSEVIRQAWDSHKLHVTAKNAGEEASDPHVSIIGQITREEFKDVVSPTDVSNGFLNRFLFCAVNRSKLLPNPVDGPDPAQLGAIVEELKTVIAEARERPYRLTMTSEASQLWAAFYRQLPDRDGLIGDITARAEPHIIRIAMIYALSEREAEIDVRHLEAAIAVWSYCEASIEWVFQKHSESDAKSSEDPLLEALAQAAGKGMKRSEISKVVFKGNRSSEEIGKTLHGLAEKRRIRCRKLKRTTGKPVEVWYLAEFFPPDSPETP